MWNDATDLVDWSVPAILDTIRSAQACQRAYGMSHALNGIWSRAINEGCAEMAARVKAGDPEATAAKL
jgi:hypothetical protein